jgi:hypothetical protein
MRRTSRISWAPSGWLIDYHVDAPATSLNIFTCPDDFYAVRLGFANITTTPYVISKAIAASSTTPGDFVNPTGGGSWIPFTFMNNGGDVDALVTDGNASHEIVVSGAVHCACGDGSKVPKWTWTDWTPIVSVRRTDDANAPRMIMVRVLLAGDATVTQPNGNFNGYFSKADVNRGFEYGAGWVPLDLVTGPNLVFENAAGASFGEARSTVACIQFLTRNRGIVGMAAGDSHHQGTSTTTQFLNYLLRTTVALGSGYVGTIPFGYASTARGGATSQEFFSSLLTLLPAIRPGFVVLPGWSFNDQSDVYDDEHANDLFMARLLQAADSCIMSGAIPIFLTPFPRDAGSMKAIGIEPWRKLRATILSMKKSGAMVIDATSILGAKSAAGEFDGTYVPEFSSDGVHPNDAGHGALVEPLMAVVRELAGLTDR